MKNENLSVKLTDRTGCFCGSAAAGGRGGVGGRACEGVGARLGGEVATSCERGLHCGRGWWADVVVVVVVDARVVVVAVAVVVVVVSSHCSPDSCCCWRLPVNQN